MSKDYYNILGVGKNASKEEIKKAYKRLAKQHHPDLNKGEKLSEEKFKEINEAYKILSDDNARQHYDNFGNDPRMGSAGFNPEDFGFDFGDIFGSFFGGGTRPRQRRGADLKTEIILDIREVFEGVEKTINVRKHEVCNECNGTGAETERDIIICMSCNGTGSVKRSQRTPFGVFQTSATCRECRGSGATIKNICKQCQGDGTILNSKKIKIKIPKGVESGTTLRVSGEGEAVKGGVTGDLYVLVYMEEDEKFQRKGQDIIVELPISIFQAALGDTVHVDTLHGGAELKIPKGTQSNTLFRMKGQGLPYSFGYGDQYVKVIVEIPVKMTKKQEEALSKLSREFGKDLKAKSFLEKIFP